MNQLDPDDARALYLQIQRLADQLNALQRLADRVIAPEVRQELAYERQFSTETIYHMVPKTYYESYPADQAYLPEPYEQDGFIHCTRGADLLAMVANRYYHSVPGDFLMLTIDVRALQSRLTYEALDPAVPFPFPHIYGPINRAAILEVIPMKRSADGTFLVPPFLNQD